MRTVDCVFTMRSPWAYIGHSTLVDICRRHGAEIRFRPVSLEAVFPASGGLPLAARHPSRQAYRWVELQRWRRRRGLSFALQPRHWPFDAALADRSVVALVQAGRDPEGFIAAGFRAVWEQERDLADPGELAALLGAAGHDAGAVLEDARSPRIADTHAEDTRRAIAQGVFGSPSYLLDGEIFWGQDRLDLLDDALAHPRPPFDSGAAPVRAGLPVPPPIV